MFDVNKDLDPVNNSMYDHINDSIGIFNESNYTLKTQKDEIKFKVEN